MESCGKERCIANLNGQCCVPKCCGEVRSTGRKAPSEREAQQEYFLVKFAIEKLLKER